MKIEMKPCLAALLAAVFAAGLSGCGLSSAVSGHTPASTAVSVALKGTVHGGQQPVTGSAIQLYAAGSSGYGSAATALIPSGSYFAGGTPGCVASSSQTCYSNVVTGAGGTFNITGDYQCPSSTAEVYMVSIGGSPGSAFNTNANLALMAALGPCGQLSSTTSVVINELTTVASVWALSPFMTGVTSVGTSSTNALGLTNAFAAVNKLVTVGNGTVSGPALPSNATLPIAKINTLADVLAACINSSGGTAGDITACGTLFSAATAGSSVPTDTITAAMNIARHPGVNVSSLFGLVNSQSPFQTTLATAPTDWTLVVTYTGGGLSAPNAIATDTSGNVWLPNNGNNSVSKFSTTGAALSGSNGITVGSLSGPWAIATDLNGNAWVANSAGNTVTEILSAGTSANVFSGGGLVTPRGIAVDGSGNVWVGNWGNGSTTEISTTQTLTNVSGTGLGSATAVAIGPP